MTKSDTAELLEEHTVVPSALPLDSTPAIMEPLDVDNPQNPVRTKLQIAAILLALYLSLFCVALDQTIVATALPTIVSDLGSASGYFWVGAAFLLATAAAGPIWAKCSDIWGRKPALLAAVIMFATGSILAATSVNMRMLIAARALQGTAGGGLLQLVNIVISDIFSMKNRSLYFGLSEVIWCVAGGSGPIIGGAFTQLANWRWCFWVNLPISGTTFILLLLFLKVHQPKTPLMAGLRAIDWFGTVSILAVTIMILLGLDFGGATFPWDSPTVICLIVFGALMIVVFVVSEVRLARYPLIPTALFSNPSIVAAFALTFGQGMVFIGGEYYLPLYFQSVKGASPVKSGALLVPFTMAEAATGCLGGVLIHRYGRYREIMWVGTLFMTVGYGLFITYNVSTSIGRFVGLGIVGGLGTGLLFQSPLVAVQVMVEQADIATATATLGFIRSLATSISVVLGGVVFQNGMDARSSSLQAMGLKPNYVRAFSHGDAAANVELIKTIENPFQRYAVKSAFASSMRNLWIMYTAIAGLTLVVSFFIKHRDLSNEHTETRTGIDEMTQRKSKTVGENPA